MTDANSIEGILSRLADACKCQPDQVGLVCGPCLDAEVIAALQSRLAGAEKALRCVRPLLNDLSNNDRAVIDSPLWRFGQDAKVQLRSIDDTLRKP